MSLNQARQGHMIWSLKPQLYILPPGYGVFEALERPLTELETPIMSKLNTLVSSVFVPSQLALLFYGLAPASSQAQDRHSPSPSASGTELEKK